MEVHSFQPGVCWCFSYMEHSCSTTYVPGQVGNCHQRFNPCCEQSTCIHTICISSTSSCEEHTRVCCSVYPSNYSCVLDVCVWVLHPAVGRVDLEQRNSSQWGKGTKQRHKALSEEILLLSEIAGWNCWCWSFTAVFHSIGKLSHSVVLKGETGGFCGLLQRSSHIKFNNTHRNQD